MARRHLAQWAFFGVVLAAAVVLAATFLSANRTARLTAATRDLSDSAASARLAIKESLNSTGMAISEAVRLTLEKPGAGHSAAGSEQFARIERMVPSMRTLQSLDRRGIVLASNRQELLGQNFSSRDYFIHASEFDDPHLLHVSEPFRTVLGVWTVSLVVSRRDALGAFDGIVTGTLDPAHLRAVLKAVQRPGQSLALVHGSGSVLVRLPEEPVGEDVSAPTREKGWLSDEMIMRAVTGPLPGSGLDMVAEAEGRRWLITLQPLIVEAHHQVEGKLVLAMAADEAEVLWGWRASAAGLGAAMLLFAVIAAAGLAHTQRAERRERERLGRDHALALAAEADRRRLATIQAVAARASRQAGWSIDEVTGESRWTDELRAIIGVAGSVPASERALVDRLDPDGLNGLAAGLQALRSEGEALDKVLEFERPDGEQRFLRLVAQAVRGDDGRITSVEGAAADVTDSARTLAALRRNEALFRGVFDNAAAGIAVLDPRGKARQANRRYAEMLGWPIEVLNRMPMEQLIHPDDVAAEARDWAALLGGAIDSFTSEKRFACADGQWRWARVALTAVRDEEGRLARVIAVIEDIADRKAAEENRLRLEGELREAQKMEAIGTLAGGIAHDFNNVLGVMLGNAEVVRTAVERDREASEALDQIFKAGLLGRSLVERVLAFSRRQPGAAAPIDLRDVVGETAALLRSTMPASAVLGVEVPGTPVFVEGAPQQLQQVLLNLCNNALQAIGDRPGHIAISLQSQPMPGGTDMARLTVGDDGCGMPESVRSRVFEPFFTTKPVGQGTGLGLPVVRSIVLDHKGTIEVASAAGEGTVVTVSLPCCAAPVDAAQSPPVPTPARRGQGELIAYVDDNRMMTASARRLLERAGYRVAPFASASEALRALADPGFAPDAIVTDFSMPDLSGLELVEQLPPGRRSLPLAIVSGFVSDELRGEAGRLGVRFVLRKEDSFRELVATVGRMLDPASSDLASASAGDAEGPAPRVEDVA